MKRTALALVIALSAPLAIANGGQSHPAPTPAPSPAPTTPVTSPAAGNEVHSSDDSTKRFVTGAVLTAAVICLFTRCWESEDDRRVNLRIQASPGYDR